MDTTQPRLRRLLPIAGTALASLILALSALPAGAVTIAMVIDRHAVITVVETDTSDGPPLRDARARSGSRINALVR